MQMMAPKVLRAPRILRGMCTKSPAESPAGKGAGAHGSHQKGRVANTNQIVGCKLLQACLAVQPYKLKLLLHPRHRLFLSSCPKGPGGTSLLCCRGMMVHTRGGVRPSTGIAFGDLAAQGVAGGILAFQRVRCFQGARRRSGPGLCRPRDSRDAERRGALSCLGVWVMRCVAGGLEADDNSDGYLDEDEFVNAVRRAKFF